MSLFLSLLILCSIIFLSRARDKCLSFSGGGIRAAMGAYRTMRAIEDAKKLGEIKCISMISGGSWGFILWLYEEKKDAASHNIVEYIDHNDQLQWGTRGPFEFSPTKRWYDKWGSQIRRNILDMTSLKNKPAPPFVDGVRKQLDHKGLQKADIYFVVESVSLGLTLELIDYCWFRNKPMVPHLSESDEPSVDGFECSQTFTSQRYNDLKIKGKDKKMHAITLLDVLNYCSSAWATKAGGAYRHMCRTREFHAQGHTIPAGAPVGDPDVFRLVDAGATFNLPLIPYMVKQRFRASKVQIWSFDFSEYSKKKSKMLAQFLKLKPAMKNIGKPIVTEFKYRMLAPAEYIFEINERLIIHCPMYGQYLKGEFVHFFPTMEDKVLVKKWNIKEFIFFQSEWDGHVKEVVKDW